MAYKIYKDFSKEKFLAGDKISVFSSSNLSFYLNFEDWDEKYKLYLQLDPEENRITISEKIELDWKREISVSADSASGSSLSVEYDESGTYIIEFCGNEIKIQAACWPGEIRQVGSEAEFLDIDVELGHNRASANLEAFDELANEMAE